MRPVTTLVHAEHGSRSAGEDEVRRKSFFVVFAGETIFGLEVKEARAIFRVGVITPIPLTRREVAGFINLRGKVVVAVSLRRKAGLPAGGGCREDIAIWLEKGGQQFALLVDRVGDVLSLPESAGSPVPPHCDALQSRYTRELYAHESKLIPILDVERLFDFAA